MHKEKEKQALILGSRTVNGGPQASLWNILQIGLALLKKLIWKKSSKQKDVSLIKYLLNKREIYYLDEFNTMDPALKYSARVVKTSWFMLRKCYFLICGGYLVKMCCYRTNNNKRLHPT